MQMDWLLGPRARVESDRVVIGSRYLLDRNDFLDLVDALEAAGGPVDVVRLAGWGDDTMPTDREVDVLTDSDGDVAAVKVHNARRGAALAVHVDADLGRNAKANIRVFPRRATSHVEIECAAALHRATEILNGKHRRMPVWKWFQTLERVADAALVALVVIVFTSTHPSLWPTAVALVAAIAARSTVQQALGRLRQRHQRWHVGVGQIVIDTRPRERVRLERANHRRDLRVGIIGAAVGALLTVLGSLAVANADGAGGDTTRTTHGLRPVSSPPGS